MVLYFSVYKENKHYQVIFIKIYLQFNNFEVQRN